MWRYTSLNDLWRLVQATLLSMLFYIAVTHFIFRFHLLPPLALSKGFPQFGFLIWMACSRFSWLADYVWVFAFSMRAPTVPNACGLLGPRVLTASGSSKIRAHHRCRRSRRKDAPGNS